MECDRTDLERASVEEINRRMTEGATQALKAHRAAGQQVVVWRDGQVVILNPEQIQTLGETPQAAAAPDENSWPLVEDALEASSS